MEMAYSHSVVEASDQLLRFKLLQNGTELSFAEVLDKWRSDEDFVRWYTDLLVSSPWPAAYWEHPPLWEDKLDEVYEFSLRAAGALANLSQNPVRYRSYFSGGLITTFLSLGKDALLVVPEPRNDETNYTHLLSFLRSADFNQIKALWSRTSISVTERLSERPLYLSTHGTGVAWLHVRLDERPKYYGDGRYRK